MLFQTRGLGSWSSNSRAFCSIAFRSETKSAQVEQVLRCCSCSKLWPPSSPGKTRSNSSQVILPSPRYHFFGSSRLGGLFGSARFEEVSQPHSSFVQLRFA